MTLFTTWEEWLDAGPIPLTLAAPLIICGPCFKDCELTRTQNLCAVWMRGLAVLETWHDLQGSHMCRGIEYARAVNRLNGLMGIDTFATLGGTTSLLNIVEWAKGKRSVSLPQELLDILKKESSQAGYTPPPKHVRGINPNKITVGRVMLAYNLNGVEAQDLIDAIGAEFDESSPYPLSLTCGQYSPIKSIQGAEDIAFNTKGPLSQIFFDWMAYLCGWEANGDSPINYTISFQGIYDNFMRNSIDETRARQNCVELLVCALRDYSLIDKKQCILYLHQLGYSLQREDVKGLSRELVERIIRENTADNDNSSQTSSRPAGAAEEEPANQQQLITLTDPAEIIRQLENKKTSSGLSVGDIADQNALIGRLQNMSFAYVYRTYVSIGTNADAPQCSKSGREACERAIKVAAKKLGICIDAKLIDGRAKKARKS